MNRIKSWWSAHKPTKRRLIQLYAALLFNANIKGFATGRIYQGPLKNICTPGLNCYSCPGAVGACPMGALQNALSSSNHTVPFYMFGIILLYGLLFGRWICGFLCPFGLIQDLLHKIKTPKLGKSRLTRVLSYLKYVILAFFVILIPLAYVGFPMPSFCKYICPAGTLEGAIGLLSNPANENQMGMLGGLFTWKFFLMVTFLVGAIFIYRFFCRFFCPLGAIYGFFNRISLVGVKMNRDACTDCGLCIGKCKMDIRHVGDHECINCGECIEVCPTHAIQWKGPKILLPKQAIGGEIPVKVKATVAAEAAPVVAEPVLETAAVAAAASDAEVLTVAVPESATESATETAEVTETVETAEVTETVETAESAETTESAEAVEAAEATEATESAEAAEATEATESAEAAEATEATEAVEPTESAEATETVESAEAVAETKKAKKGSKAEKKPKPEKPAAAEGKKSFDFRYWLDRIVYGREFADCKGAKADDIVARAQEHKQEFIIRTSVLGTLFALLLTVTLVANLGGSQDAAATLPSATEAQDGSSAETNAELDALPPYGNQVGYLCPAMELSLYNGEKGTFNVKDNTGKVTVINFWGTWCGPCIAELPHFDDVASDYGDKVTVVAVHSNFISPGAQAPEEWIPENYPNTSILFAQDPFGSDPYGDGEYGRLLGVAGMYPTTVILDARGVITCVRPGSITHEELVAEVEKALGN